MELIVELRNKIKQKELISKIVLVFVISAVILGNLFGIKSLRFLGIIPTYYRVVMILATLYYLYRRFISKKTEKKLSKLLIITIGMMAFWILYVLVQMLALRGIDNGEGLRDILALVLAALSIYCVYEANTSKQNFMLIIKTIRIIVAALVVLALLEMTMAYHLPLSKYNDPGFLESQWYFEHFGSRDIEWHTATGVYYNQNDFFFVLSMFSIVFLPAKRESIRQKVFSYSVLTLILLLISMNNAFITFIAIAAGVMAFLIITKAGLLKHTIIWGSILLFQFFISKWIRDALLYFGDVLTGRVVLFNGVPHDAIMENKPEQLFESAETIVDVLSQQLDTAAAEQGSFYRRLIMYVDSLGAFIKTYGLGLGPGGIQSYFSKNPNQANILDPHNWWLEVLVQYGIFVFIAYLFVMIYSFIKAIKAYMKTHFWGFAIVAGMFISFVIGCIAPSSLLGASYQWMPLALAVSLLGTSHLYEKTE